MADGQRRVSVRDMEQQISHLVLFHDFGDISSGGILQAIRELCTLKEPMRNK